MTNEPKTARRWIGPAALCRMDALIADAFARDALGPLAASAAVLLLGGAALYGFVFGLWRSPWQGALSAAKLPLVLFATVALSGCVNGMLAQTLGSGLSFRRTLVCILLGLAVSAVLLAAVSPVALFFVLQLAPPGAPGDLTVYRALLPLHTAAIGACGVAGCIRLYRLLLAVAPNPAAAGRTLASWILVSGLVGCEVSWVASPFLARPDLPVPLLNPGAFQGNFFEYLWRTTHGRF